MVPQQLVVCSFTTETEFSGATITFFGKFHLLIFHKDFLVLLPLF